MKIAYTISLLLIIWQPILWGETNSPTSLKKNLAIRDARVNDKLEKEPEWATITIEVKTPEVLPKNQMEAVLKKLITIPETKKKAEHKDYIVTKGDTLYSIASKIYGTPSRWKEIHKANEALLGEKEHLAIGMRLILP